MKYPATIKVTENIFEAEGGICYGCFIKSGKLFPAYSANLKSGSAPSDIKSIGYCAGNDIFLTYANGRDWFSRDGLYFTEMLERASVYSFICEESDKEGVKSFILGGESAFLYDGKDFVTRSFGGKIKDGVIHCGRLFGIDCEDNFVLRWSGSDGAFDWKESISGAGWLRLAPDLGEVLNLLNLGENLVAVRRMGLTVLSAYGNPENFRTGIQNYFCPEIFKNTAATVGDRLLFLCADGARCFTGGAVKPVETACGLKDFVPECCAAFGCVYFAGGQCASGGAVFAFDTIAEEGYIIRVSADKLVAGNGLLAYCAGSVYEISKGGEFVFKSGKVDFGSRFKKVLRELFIDGEGVYDVIVSNGIVARSFYGVEGGIRPNMCGQSFEITVKGTDKVYSVRAGAEAINEI